MLMEYALPYLDSASWWSDVSYWYNSPMPKDTDDCLWYKLSQCFSREYFPVTFHVKNSRTRAKEAHPARAYPEATESIDTPPWTGC